MTDPFDVGVFGNLDQSRKGTMLSFRSGTWKRGDDDDRRLRIARMVQDMLNADNFPAGMTVFARIEMGDETFRIDMADDPKRIPKGNQVLVR